MKNVRSVVQHQVWDQVLDQLHSQLDLPEGDFAIWGVLYMRVPHRILDPIDEQARQQIKGSV